MNRHQPVAEFIDSWLADEVNSGIGPAGNVALRAGTLQISLELCIPEKELAKTRSQISFIYFQSQSWYSVRNYKIPKGMMKTRFESRLPKMSSWKKLHTLDLNLGPLHKKQVFCHWTIKADIKGFHISILVPFRTTKDSFLLVTFTSLADLFPQLGISHEQLCDDSQYLALWSNVKILTNVAGVLGSNPGWDF
jgi:hypothetical protein